MLEFTKLSSEWQTGETLAWVCTACLGLFDRQLVFEILEHLPYFVLLQRPEQHMLSRGPRMISV